MNGDLLFNLTLLTTFLCLGFNLWFAIYLLARSSANHLTFRAIVALVALAFYFNSSLNNLLAATNEQTQIRSLTTLIALIACHDLTHYLLEPAQRKKLYAFARGIIILGVVAVILAFSAPKQGVCSPLYVCPLEIGFPWVIIDLLKALVFGSILYNLWLIRQEEGPLQNIAFYGAVLVGLGAAFYGIISTAIRIDLPRVVPNVLILVALVLLAYSVARDRTLIAERTVPYDLPITLLTISSIVVIYLVTSVGLKLKQEQVFLIAILAIFTHAAYDFIREFLNNKIFQRERKLKAEIHTLEREASENISLEPVLKRSLAILCHNLSASGSFIALREADQYQVVASLNSFPEGSPVPSREVTLDGPTQPSSAILQRIAWLVPAFLAGKQVGLVGIGPRKDKIPYSEEDLYWLEDITHEIGHLIHIHEWQQSLAVHQIKSRDSALDLGLDTPLVQSSLVSVFAYSPDSAQVKCIEDGFRNLHDYAELGNSDLVALFGIQGNDHIERGKQVHNRLIEMLEKLRPTGQLPKEPIPSEWHPYTILHDSYVKELLSREIMARLYIGEGTYYRIRRQALRGITRAVLETGLSAGLSRNPQM